MVPPLFSAGSRKVELIIRPESKFVVFEGVASEGAPLAYSRGNVTIRIHKATDIRRIRLTLRGVGKVVMSNGLLRQTWEESKVVLFEETRDLFTTDDLGSSRTLTFGKGEYTYDYEFELDPKLPESIEGMHIGSAAENRGYCQILYMLRAIVERPFPGNITAMCPLRVIRTLSRNPETQDFEQIHEAVWNNKISYRIVVPRVSHVFGSTVSVNFELTPLKKGLNISKVRMDLLEMVLTRVDEGPKHDWTTVVASVETGPPQNAERLVPEDGTVLLDEALCFTIRMPLPRSFKECRQSVETDICVIKHVLKIAVNILNPDGHTSQLSVRAGIHLYVPPFLQIEDNQQTSLPPSVDYEGGQEAINDVGGQESPPPTYGQHILDTLYSDIDYAGTFTPMTRTGGANTPFNAHSRSSSSEALSGLLNFGMGPADHSQMLHSRLATLQEDVGTRGALTQNPQLSESYTNIEQMNVSLNTPPPLSPGEPECHRSPPTEVLSAPRGKILRTRSYGPMSPHSPAQSDALIGSDSSSHAAMIPRSSTFMGYPATLVRPPNIRSSSTSSLFGVTPDRGGSSPQLYSSQLFYDIHALSQTPSYNTAVRSPLPVTSRTELCGMGLPSYEVALREAREEIGRRESGGRDNTILTTSASHSHIPSVGNIARAITSASTTALPQITVHEGSNNNGETSTAEETFRGKSERIGRHNRNSSNGLLHMRAWSRRPSTDSSHSPSSSSASRNNSRDDAEPTMKASKHKDTKMFKPARKQ